MKTSRRKQFPLHSASTSSQINSISNTQDSVQDTSIDKIMKIVEISENKSLVILKQSPHLFFCFTYGEMKVSAVAGHIKLDGYPVKTGETVPISCGFGNYQILVGLDKYANFPSSKHLYEVLSKSEVPESFHEEINKYLDNNQGSLSESIIIKLDKWRWPWLASLRRLIRPESTMGNYWFGISFSDIKSPIVQWPHIVSELVEDVKESKHFVANPERIKTHVSCPSFQLYLDQMGKQVSTFVLFWVLNLFKNLLLIIFSSFKIPKY